MKRSVIVSLFSLAAAVANTTAAHAQIEIEEVQGPKAQFRKGLWLSAGAGWGSQSCSACTVRLSSLSGTVVVGGSLSGNLLIGAGLTGWAKSDSAGTKALVMLDARFRWYPVGGLNLTFGAGLGIVGDGVYGPGIPAEWGTSFLLGAAWDFRVARGVSIAPYVHYSAAKTETLDAGIAQVGLSFTIH